MNPLSGQTSEDDYKLTREMNMRDSRLRRPQLSQSNSTWSDPGRLWQFRAIFGDTQAYMTHNDVVGAIQIEEPGFWKAEVKPGTGDLGAELADDAPVWAKYVEESTRYDNEMIERWNAGMDVLLVFTGLFSAVLTAFIIEFYKGLRPDNTDISTRLLADIAVSLRCRENAAACITSGALPSALDFQPALATRLVNLLWFTSLSLTLTISAVALLVKQWAQTYKAHVKGPLHSHACLRQLRVNGITDWHVPTIISSLPLLLYGALMMFLSGLVIVLGGVDFLIFGVCLIITVSLGCIYLGTLIVPLFHVNCPYRTPASEALRKWLFTLKPWISNVFAMLDLNDHEHLGPKAFPRYRWQNAAIGRDALGGQMDADALAWLVCHSNDQATVQQALKATAALSPDFKAFQGISVKEMAARLVQHVNMCLDADRRPIHGMQDDIAGYLQGLYLVLQGGDPSTDVLETAHTLGIQLPWVDSTSASEADVAGPWASDIVPPNFEHAVDSLMAPDDIFHNRWRGVGPHVLFKMRTFNGCAWVLRDVVDQQMVMSPSTLCLVIKRACALHLQHPQEDVGSMVRPLCILLYSELLSQNFDPKDRLSRLLVLGLYMLTNASVDISYVQAERVESQTFRQLLIEGLVVVLSHQRHYGLKHPSMLKLWKLVLHRWDNYEQDTMRLAYGRLAWKNQRTFLASLLLYSETGGHDVRPLTIRLLRLPLETHIIPWEASEIAIQYLIHCDLANPSAYHILHTMSSYPHHCIRLVSSAAWRMLLKSLGTSDGAFQLVGHVLYTLVTGVSKSNNVFKEIHASHIFRGLGRYLDTYEATKGEAMVTRHSDVMQEWTYALIELSHEYRIQILENGLNRFLTILGEGYSPEFDVLLTELERCLA